MTLSSQKKHLFYFSYFRAHLTTLLLKILGGDECMGRPPPQTLGGPSPQSPLGFRHSLKLVSKSTINILLESERIIVRSFARQVVAVEQLRVLHDHFKDNIDFRRLPVQLQVLANISRPTPTPVTVSQPLYDVEAVMRIDNGKRGLIPDVLVLMTHCLIGGP